MSVFAYYKAPERRFAGLFAIACAVYFIALVMLSGFTVLFERCGWEVSASGWQTISSALDWWTAFMGVYAVMTLLSPGWYIVRNKPQSEKIAVSAAAKTVGLAFCMFVVLFPFCYLGIMDSAVFAIKKDRRTRKVVDYYAEYKDIRQNMIASFAVPVEATQIKIFDDAGFGYRHFGMSCTISREGLDRFACSQGYKFVRADIFPGLLNDHVTEELYPLDEDRSRYLYCSARENKKEIPGWGSEGHLAFVYDIQTERLYASYYD